MCIMEMRPESANATLAQALYHNTMTVITDCSMAEVLYFNRHKITTSENIVRAASHLREAAQIFNEAFSLHSREVHEKEMHSGHERTLAEIQKAAVKDAAVYETRRERPWEKNAAILGNASAVMSG